MKTKCLNDFSIKKFQKSKLSQIQGGDSGIETNTCKGTTKIVPGLGGYADSSEDGDWYSTC